MLVMLVCSVGGRMHTCLLSGVVVANVNRVQASLLDGWLTCELGMVALCLERLINSWPG